MNKKEEERKKEIYEEALKVALDNRKFEIELYWRRTKYFFDAFIALGGFSVIVSLLGLYDKGEGTLMYTFLIMLECVGIVSAFAWVCANKGSKYWQVNWEQYVDELGEEILGPLFQHPIDPRSNGLKRYSVSKVNLILSYYVLGVWIVMLGLTIKLWCLSYCFVLSDAGRESVGTLEPSFESSLCLPLLFIGLIIVGTAIAISVLYIASRQHNQTELGIDFYRKEVEEMSKNSVKEEDSEQ